jgi:hypothetical protein
MRRSARPLLACIAATWAVMAAPQAYAAPVKLDVATQRRLGVQTAPLAAARHTAAAAGFARALDAGPLAALEADIAAAAAASQASQAEAARTRKLAAADATVSRKAAETAAAQARADAARLALLRRRVGLEWGPALAALSDARRDQLVSDVAAGRSALVRIDVAGGAPVEHGAATLDLGPRGFAQATILGPARVGDPRLQSTGLLAVVNGPAALWLATGSVVPAALASGGAHSGVIVPREALLRSGGQTFAYVRKDAQAFERRPVTGGTPVPAGLFAPTGFRPGEPVVVSGAAKLFAAEQAPAGEE